MGNVCQIEDEVKSIEWWKGYGDYLEDPRNYFNSYEYGTKGFRDYADGWAQADFDRKDRWWFWL